MELILLNIKQKEESGDLLKFYRFIYLCGECGSIYGSDLLHEKNKICPLCELNVKKKKKKK